MYWFVFWGAPVDFCFWSSCPSCSATDGVVQ